MAQRIRIVLAAVAGLLALWVAAVNRLPSIKARKASWRTPDGP